MMWQKEIEIQYKTKSIGKKQAEVIRETTDQKIDTTIKNQNVSCVFEEKQIHYRSIFETVSHIYRNEGIFAFSRGVSARIMLNTPSTAISWGTYEIMKVLLCGKSN